MDTGTDSSGVHFVPMTGRLKVITVGVVALWLSSLMLAAIVKGDRSVVILNISLWVNVSVVLIPLMFLRRDTGWLHPLVLPAAWTVLITMIRDSGMYVGGLYEHRALLGHSPEQLNGLMTYCNILLSFGTLATILGFVSLPPLRVPVLRPRTIHGLCWKLPLMVGVAIGGAYLWAREVGGVTELLLWRSAPRTERLISIPGRHWIVVASVLAYALPVWLAARRTAYRAVAFWSTLAITLPLGFFLTGSRSQLIYPVFTLLLVHVKNTRSLPFVRGVLIGMAALAVVGALGEFRRSHFGKTTVDPAVLIDVGTAEAFREGIAEFTARGTTGRGDLAVIANVPASSPLLLGQTYLGMLLTPIPSVLLPFQKPPTAATTNVALFFGGDYSIPVSAAIEAYWNFHIPGLLITMFVWGLVLAYIGRVYARNAGSAAITVLYLHTLLQGGLSGTLFAPWLQGCALTMVVGTFFCGWPRVQEWKRYT